MFPIIQQQSEMVDVLQNALSPDQYTVQTPASSQLPLANPHLPLDPWLARKW
jgi:hypothetical protein